MICKSASFVIVALAIGTPSTQADCVDKNKEKNNCFVVYNGASKADCAKNVPCGLSTNPVLRCPALATYRACLLAWVGTCNVTAITNPIVEALNGAVTQSCGVVCKGQPVCGEGANAHWDSSASSSASKPLDSLNSDSLHAGSSGSTQSSSSGSGSSGSWLEAWQWILVALLLAACVGGGGAAAFAKKGKGKAKKTKNKELKPAPAAPPPAPAAPAAAAPAAAPAIYAPAGGQELAPLIPMQFPLATSSTLIPSYSMVAPQAAPLMGGYSAFPGTTSYAAPMAYAPTTAQQMVGPITPMALAAPMSYSGAPAQFAFAAAP